MVDASYRNLDNCSTPKMHCLASRSAIVRLVTTSWRCFSLAGECVFTGMSWGDEMEC
jgi:hypothetical protein